MQLSVLLILLTAGVASAKFCIGASIVCVCHAAALHPNTSVKLWNDLCITARAYLAAERVGHNVSSVTDCAIVTRWFFRSILRVKNIEVLD
ncbi:predicted protein [Pyrenophora tritici-repentis Pt-1C-BFP]|uniref:Secreted protein n=1 Tax=Pyrenophora tritici-repentis (strain Pt-1C-BFP) TaxID=426418 RepID=B2VYW6_PYRTR|nr:uncharacterized protein PTRG_02606 [Pyrenophora tritici-repentis Pt-1C-BFP]EDU45129.1 predicted protein [Pyrenophora tritici-repentis Pt-1C-BFP]